MRVQIILNENETGDFYRTFTVYSNAQDPAKEIEIYGSVL